MIYRSHFPHNLFIELDRMQRDMQQAFGFAPTIRGSNWGGFPAMNMSTTLDAVHIHLFVPGIDPADIDVQIDKGVLAIAGSRRADPPAESEHGTLHVDERFAGRFRRVITLPDDADETQVDANYRDGVLRIRLPRRQASQARKIPVQ